MKFKAKDPLLVDVLDRVQKNPELICDYLVDSELLVGLLVDKDEKKLVLSTTKNFKALAVFSTEKSLLEFSPAARPTIFSGKEIALLGLKSDSRLLHLDPPDGLVINGSKLKAIVNGVQWQDPVLDESLRGIVYEQLKDFDEITCELAAGQWTDAKLILQGDFETCAKAASMLGQFLHRDPKVIELLPSGADIVYLS